MSTQHSKLLGNMTHLVSAAMEGILQAGIPESEADAVFATIAGGKDKLIVKNAFLLEALKIAEEKGWILNYFDLGNGDVFLVDEYIDLDVDDSIPIEEIERLMRIDQCGWEYVGTAPQGGTHKVKLAIGRLSRGWSEELVSDILTRPKCRLRGSGVWVREAYLKVSPNYDGKGSIFFPDKTSSCWRWHGSSFYLPRLWPTSERRWFRDLPSVQFGGNPSDRFCFLVE